MQAKCLKNLTIALLLAAYGSVNANAGGIIRVYYDGISGTNVSDLLNATSAAGTKIFPDGPNKDGNPLITDFILNSFEAPPPANNKGYDNYGSMMQGFVTAPQTGNYTFWIASDDSSELWLSTDTTPANKKKIASVTGAVGFRAWTSQTNQTSAAVSLVQGRSYYVQVLHKEGTGNDFVSIGWQLPDGTKQQPMSANYLQPYPVVSPLYKNPGFIIDLADQTVTENSLATFAVTLNADPPISYKWYRGISDNPTQSITDTDTNAIMPFYSFKASLKDNNSSFRVVVGAKSGVVVSRTARLTVVPDSTPPTLTSASSTMWDPTSVAVTFSELVDAASSADLVNYQLNNGAMVYGVIPGATADKVTLITSELKAGSTYILTVTGVKDMAARPNPSATSLPFTVNSSFASFKMYTGASGTATNNLTGNAKYIAGTYDTLTSYPSFEIPSAGLGDLYIGQLQGYFVPSESALYQFVVWGDDASLLYLSTDEMPANKKVIAMVSGWTGYQELTKYPEQKSAPIQLTAGKKYYIEGAYIEGTGGDMMGAAVRKTTDADYVKGAGLAIQGANLQYFGSLGSVGIAASAQPASVTADEGGSTSFTVSPSGITGTPPYSYQWYKNGQAISGATNNSYSEPRIYAADNGAVYTLLVKNNFSLVASSGAVVTVNPDKTAPAAMVSAFFTNTVNVVYSERVDAATAGNAANYALKDSKGAAVTVDSVTVVDEKTVKLATANLTFGGLYSLTVSGIKDQSAAANVMVATSIFPAYNFLSFDKINNTQVGSIVGDVDKMTIVAGGADIWGTADGMNFLYQQVSGNFDLKIKAESLTQADVWAKAGIMARESLVPGSRNAAILTTPPAPGQNLITVQQRPTEGAATISIAGAMRPTPTRYPNQWLRMLRFGNSFYTYYGTNGTDWTYITNYTFAVAMPDSLYVGVAVTSHSTANTTTAVLSGAMVIPPVPITFTSQIANGAFDEQRGTNLVIAVTGSGPFFYQWQKNGTNIAGATNATYNTGKLALADNGAKYRCVVTGPFQTANSAESVVTVNKDTKAPAIVSSGVLSANPSSLIADVVETGGDNEATDTVSAKWSGVTFVNGIAGEYANPYKVLLFGEDVPTFVDRTHQWNGASTNMPLPAYLVGGQYIMSGNDNRDNASYKLQITLSEPASIYMLVDNRLTDGNAEDPPESTNTWGNWVGMKWLATEGFKPVMTGKNHLGDATKPDEVGVDEGGDGVGPGGSIQNYSSIYKKDVSAGTYTIYQADAAGRNMYGVVIQRQKPQLLTIKFNEELDATTARDIKNYFIKDGVINSATLRTGNDTVVLSVSLPISSDISVVVNGVKDLVGNIANTTNKTDLVALTSRDVGTPAPFVLDKVNKYVGSLLGPVTITASGLGRSGKGTDKALDLGRTTGTSMKIANASFMNQAASKDVLAISLWVKKYDIVGSSAFWGRSPSSSGTERGYQAHIPWSDNTVYFDTAGCCDAKLQRVNASIKNFDGYKAAGTNDSYWTNYWHHFLFVKNTSIKSVYIDGKLLLQGTNTSALPTDFTDLFVGSDHTVSANNMHGLVDDFAVFGSAVSDANIALLAGGASPAGLAGESLLAFWDFEDAATVPQPDSGVVMADPLVPATVYASSGSSMEVIAGGTDIYNKADGFQFTYRVMEGDFDVKVRVESLVLANNWSKAGVMVREDLTGGSRNINIVVDPMTPGANTTEVNQRIVAGEATVGVSGANVIGVTYPNAWVRLIRQGDRILALRSTNGVNWDLRATIVPTNPYPAKVYVGLATTSHDNAAGKTTTAVYKDFSLSSLAIPSLVSVSGGPSNDKIYLSFSEPMDKVSAENFNNYFTGGGIYVISAKLDSTEKKVILSTSAQVPYTYYTVYAASIKSKLGVMISPDTIGAFSGWTLAAGVVQRKIWNSMPNHLTNNLLVSPKFPDSPDTTTFIGSMETPSNSADNYSQQLISYIVPPVTGDYTFYIASDDAGMLYLSTDDNPANKKLIASVNGWAGIREYSKEANQKSAPIRLQAGQMYYIEALHSEGGGGDNLAVAWTLPGQPAIANGAAPIAGFNLVGYVSPDISSLGIMEQPVSVSVLEKRNVSFTVKALANPDALLYQWEKKTSGSGSWMIIPGANSATYSLPMPVELKDNGSIYRVLVYNLSRSELSQEASLSVAPDIYPPRISSAAVLINSTNIVVKFDEKITPASADNIENWVLFGTQIITSVKLQSDGQMVLVTVDKPVSTKVKIFAQEIYDLMGNPMNMFASVKLLNITTSDIGTKNAAGVFTDPATPGKTLATSEYDYVITAGGSDIWGTADAMHYAYRQITGDFDAKVRVVSMTQPNTWAKSVLMVREDLDANSRSVQVLTTATSAAGGQNLISAQGRPTKAASCVSYGSNISPPPYPNAWIRIVRSGNTFSCYTGNNGVDWTKIFDVVPATAYPNTVYVGIGGTSHDNAAGKIVVSEFSNFTITGPNVTPLSLVPNTAPVLSWPIGDEQLIESLAPIK